MATLTVLSNTFYNAKIKFACRLSLAHSQWRNGEVFWVSQNFKLTLLYCAFLSRINLQMRLIVPHKWFLTGTTVNVGHRARLWRQGAVLLYRQRHATGGFSCQFQDYNERNRTFFVFDGTTSVIAWSGYKALAQFCLLWIKPQHLSAVLFKYSNLLFYLLAHTDHLSDRIWCATGHRGPLATQRFVKSSILILLFSLQLPKTIWQ